MVDGNGWLGFVEAVFWWFVGGSFRLRLGFVTGSFGVSWMHISLCFVRDPGFVSAFPFFGSVASERRDEVGRGGGVTNSS